MGVTGLVRSIFFRNKSFEGHDDYSNVRRRPFHQNHRSWVRSYLCGDEFNSLVAVDDSGSSLLTMSQQLSSDLVIPCDSVLAIQDSASVKHLWEGEDESSSEATVTQPLQEDLDRQSQATPKRQDLDAAAITIQSAFRSYLAIRLSKQLEEDTFVKEEGFSPSTGTSLQVETGNSPFYRRKRASANQHKNKTQALRTKQDWDDSTVSSTISRLRTQNRIEAMTKRERALAYAFSQQLRICSKKKQTDPSESNMGWSWLERWMATRVPDSISIEPRTNNETNVATIKKSRHFGLTGELESCASNDLPLQMEGTSETQDFQREKNSLRAVISKRKFASSYKTQTRHRIQATKRDLQQQTKKTKKAKTTPSSCKMNR